jgi:excisionase family DNA binding protein
VTILPLPRDADAAALADDRRAVLLTVLDRALGEYAHRATVSVDELAEILGVGRSSAYALVHAHRVPNIRVGRAIRIPLPACAAILLGLEP